MNAKEALLAHPSLAALWDFQEAAGQPRVAQGPHPYVLEEMAGEIARAEDGVLGPYSAEFALGQWLRASRPEAPALNIGGPEARLTVAAWVKRHRKPLMTRNGNPDGARFKECEFIAGIWNETGEKRQYGMFLNLGIWDSREQLGGHVSAIGGPTPGHRFCMDASIGQTPLPEDEWLFLAITYDGLYARSYVNGRLDSRPERNPYYYPGGLYDGGPDGADFTVGAVDRLHSIGNFFVGRIGGLAVFDRALTQEELLSLYSRR
ncbi:MAG: hypothetical protein K0Q90_2294 [Paenibacillaceae bacterium]|jgi:hypothetical protein|nr:hypothetical protein [Paenibacillaceae bacterium]